RPEVERICERFTDETGEHLCFEHSAGCARNPTYSDNRDRIRPPVSLGPDAAGLGRWTRFCLRAGLAALGRPLSLRPVTRSSRPQAKAQPGRVPNKTGGLRLSGAEETMRIAIWG